VIKTELPRISFGIIVLNGEPFTRYCLRSIYPFAYEILVVEGGHNATRAVTTPDGHSVDGTLEVLHKFKQFEDPDDKIQIITREGHWPQKDEFGKSRTPQSRAYSERAKGDYLWQVDIDEFYKPDEMQAIIEMLSKDPTITAVSFLTHTFWARPEYVADGWLLRKGASEYHRLFKWGADYKYLTHQPPTVTDDQGRDLRTLHWIRGKSIAQREIYMYHYSLLFPWQVEQKTRIYKQQDPVDYAGIIEWAENDFLRLKNPFRVHNLYRSPSWLERYRGSHPSVILQMMNDIDRGIITVEKRPIDDVERVLNSWWYPIGRGCLKLVYFFDLGIRKLRGYLGRIKRQILPHPVSHNNLS
jgi:hypothetical protein